jgi:hypothetical protein
VFRSFAVGEVLLLEGRTVIGLVGELVCGVVLLGRIGWVLVLVVLLLGLVVVVFVGRMWVEISAVMLVDWCLCLLLRQSWREVAGQRWFRILEGVDRCWDCRGESKFASCHLGRLSWLLDSIQSVIDQA